MIRLVVPVLLMLGAVDTPPAGSPTASEMSKVIVAGAKGGLIRSGSYNRSCIASIPDDSARELIQEHIIPRLSAEEVKALDAFYGSELGQRFNADAIAERMAATVGASYTPAKFTVAETQLAGQALHSPAANKLFEAVNAESGPFIEALDGIILPLAAQCRGAP